jgi:hypothetical protein
LAAAKPANQSKVNKNSLVLAAMARCRSNQRGFVNAVKAQNDHSSMRCALMRNCLTVHFPSGTIFPATRFRANGGSAPHADRAPQSHTLETRQKLH